MFTKTIYLTRHGHIDAPGYQRTFIGQTDLPLSAVGQAQGVSLAEKLADIPLEAVYASDLSRSFDTARYLAEPRGLSVQKTPELREINLGEWEGLSFADVASRYPGEFEARGRNIVYYRPPGGESFADCKNRVLVALRDIIQRQRPGSCIAIVGHAGVNRLILCHMLGMPVSNLFCLGQDYACVNVILTGSFGYRLQALNT